MPMREDCRHFQSRTYASGEVARFCVLNLAPEAPWRCPRDCPRYQRDIIDGTFVIVADIEHERGSRPWWKVWKRRANGGFNLSER
ncbi:MAG: hypothetical protein M1435_04515 [Actinobacteria bacterium]|nr:hypothetical protein [Actinomycetota bacterium]